MGVLAASPAAVMEYTHQGNLGGKAFLLAHSARVQAMMAGKCWWQWLGAAGHIKPTVRKQSTVIAGIQAASFFLCGPGFKGRECRASSAWVFPSQ